MKILWGDQWVLLNPINDQDMMNLMMIMVKTMMRVRIQMILNIKEINNIMILIKKLNVNKYLKRIMYLKIHMMIMMIKWVMNLKAVKTVGMIHQEIQIPITTIANQIHIGKKYQATDKANQ